MAAWIGLVPRQDSTGGKQKLGPNSKQADRYFGARHTSETPAERFNACVATGTREAVG